MQHWILMVRMTGRLLQAFFSAWWRLRFTVQAHISLPPPAVMTGTEKQRFIHYFLGVTYLQVVFDCLCRHRRTKQEYFLFSNLSALASFFDDLVDARRSATAFQESSGGPLIFARHADDRRIAVQLLEKVTGNLPQEHGPVFQEYLQRVFSEEINGPVSDGTATIDLHRLQQHTVDKGGYAVLLFRTLQRPLPILPEQQSLYAFGGLLQFSDDIFDVWFDHQAGITTVATTLLEQGMVGELTELFESQGREVRRAIRLVPLSGRQTALALGSVHLILSVTRVALHHYRRLKKERGHIPMSDRALMVVDMANWQHRWHTARLLLRRK